MVEPQDLEEMVVVLRNAGYVVWPPLPTTWTCEDCDLEAKWVVYSQFAGHGFYCQQHAESQPDFGSRHTERVWVLLSLEYDRATLALLAPHAGRSFDSVPELMASLNLSELSDMAREPLPRSFEQLAVRLGLEKGWVIEVNGRFSIHPWLGRSM